MTKEQAIELMKREGRKLEKASARAKFPHSQEALLLAECMCVLAIAVIEEIE